jgi:cytoskeletal protein CcmA (bactofilin family)
MEWLQHSYLQEYVYTSNKSQINDYISDKCFGSSAFCAMKDTRMLAENWEVGFNEYNWNKVFLKLGADKNEKNTAVSQRCWLTMAQMINHYKGGNISSDEILYNVRGGFGNTEGGGPLETMQAVNYALKQEVWDEITYTYLVNTFNINGILPTIGGWSAGTPMLHTIISTIESGNIIGVSQLNGGANGAHSMVLNGYKIASNGKVYIHLLNTDNMGGSEWRYYCDLSFWGIDILATFAVNGIGAIIDAIAGTNISADMVFSYYVPPLYASGRSANASVFNDSDGDGIVDFDEIQRFGTNPFNPDSDGDGINDYEEIKHFKMCETESNIFMPYVFKLTNQTINLPQISYIDQSDFDGDGLHAAIDRDSDGDGYCDNQENNSCDRFDATRYPLGEIPLCKDYTTALLAKERLLLNDRTTCVSLNGFYCPVASYGSNFSETYGVSLGVDALIGNIYSTKSVLLRNRAEVHGNIETANSVIKQSSTAKITGSVIENSFHSNTHAAMYSTVLDNATIIGDFTIDRQLTANSGETFYSHIFGAGANNTDFIFNSGSNLIFNITGNLLAGSLKFQHGARLYPPTHGSVQFHIGNDFQWNGTIETSDMVSAAQRIMVYYYGTNRVFIQTDFAGTVIAPNAEVVIGQSGKNFYGAVYAKSIVVHQNTKITWVPFVEAQANAVVANIDNTAIQNYTTHFWER